MTIIKRGTCSSKVVISESAYSCPDCGYTEIIEGIKDEKKCPHCDITMSILSSSAMEDQKDEEDIDSDSEDSDSDEDLDSCEE